MTVSSKYILDTNVFIEAANRYYAFDLVPGFWECLVQAAQTDQLYSIDRVKQELERGKDDLTKWVKNDFSFAFSSTDDLDIIKNYETIIRWVDTQEQFFEYAKTDFPMEQMVGWLP